jgi:ABC-type glycerol-3-phosphate transport system permease component
MRKVKMSRIASYIALLTGVFVAVYPLLWMFMTSFKTNADFIVNRFGMPIRWVLDNYVQAWYRGNFGLFFRNSILVSGMSLLMMIGFSAMAAFAFTRYNFKSSNKVLFYFVIGQMLTAQVLLIAVYLVILFLNINDSLVGLSLVYVASGIPFTIFFLNGFFKSLPKELYESAEVDGYNDFRIFTNIALPLASPGLATAFIIQFLFVWNEFPLALIAISSAERTTLPVGIFRVVNDMFFTSHVLAAAGLTIAVLPIIIFYALFQRQLRSGIVAGALKG